MAQDHNETSTTHNLLYAAKVVLRGTWVGTLAAITWCAAALHAVAASGIVLASYFSAWVSRREHGLLKLFANYGGAVILHEEPTVEELESAQRGPTKTAPDIEEASWAEVPQKEGPESDDDLGPPNLFGQRTPKGQA